MFLGHGKCIPNDLCWLMLFVHAPSAYVHVRRMKQFLMYNSLLLLEVEFRLERTHYFYYYMYAVVDYRKQFMHCFRTIASSARISPTH